MENDKARVQSNLNKILGVGMLFAFISLITPILFSDEAFGSIMYYLSASIFAISFSLGFLYILLNGYYFRGRGRGYGTLEKISNKGLPLRIREILIVILFLFLGFNLLLLALSLINLFTSV